MLVLGPAVSFSCGENSLGLLHAKNRTLMGPTSIFGRLGVAEEPPVLSYSAPGRARFSRTSQMSRRAERRSRDARNFESEAAGYSSRRLGYEETIDLFLQQQGLADPLAYDRAARIRMNSPRNPGDEHKAWAMQEKRLAMYEALPRVPSNPGPRPPLRPHTISAPKAPPPLTISVPGAATLPRVPSTPSPRPPPRPRPPLRPHTISAPNVPVCSRQAP